FDRRPFTDLLTGAQLFPRPACEARCMPIRVVLVSSATLCVALAAAATASASSAATASRRTVSNLAAKAQGIRDDTETSSNWAGYVVSGLNPTTPTTFT